MNPLVPLAALIGGYLLTRPNPALSDKQENVLYRPSNPTYLEIPGIDSKLATENSKTLLPFSGLAAIAYVKTVLRTLLDAGVFQLSLFEKMRLGSKSSIVAQAALDTVKTVKDSTEVGFKIAGVPGGIVGGAIGIIGDTLFGLFKEGEYAAQQKAIAKVMGGIYDYLGTPPSSLYILSHRLGLDCATSLWCQPLFYYSLWGKLVGSFQTLAVPYTKLEYMAELDRQGMINRIWQGEWPEPSWDKLGLHYGSCLSEKQWYENRQDSSTAPNEWRYWYRFPFKLQDELQVPVPIDEFSSFNHQNMCNVLMRCGNATVSKFPQTVWRIGTDPTTDEYIDLFDLTDLLPKSGSGELYVNPDNFLCDVILPFTAHSCWLMDKPGLSGQSVYNPLWTDYELRKEDKARGLAY